MGIPDTLSALAVFIIAVFPGLAFVAGVEQEGIWRTDLTRRVLQFVFWSVPFHLVAAWPTIWWLRHYWHGGLTEFHPFPWGGWAVLFGYTLAPFVVGAVVGGHARRTGGAGWTRYLGAAVEPPSAWDHVFAWNDVEGYVRARLHSGRWVAGMYTADATIPSFAATGHNDPAIWLAVTVLVDEATGEFRLDAHSRPEIDANRGLLLRMTDTEILEYFPISGTIRDREETSDVEEAD